MNELGAVMSTVPNWLIIELILGEKGVEWERRVSKTRVKLSNLEIIIQTEIAVVGQKDREKWECWYLYAEKYIAELRG